MKGLRKYLTPFAPDQSGAVSVLFSLNGLIVIIDAGGCTGNICGFDEPRWQTQKCAVFSAGLRDMDAIMGRDDRLIEKIMKVVDRFDLSFIALIGTPVPAVIGTDYKGLARVLERKTGLPVLPINTNGMALYDGGVEKAYVELVKNIKTDEEETDSSTVGLIGLTPLDFNETAMKALKDHYLKHYQHVKMLGMDGVDDFKHLRQCAKIIVVSPAGLKAAKLIKRRYGIDYEMLQIHIDQNVDNEKILILHQQVYANAWRDALDNEQSEVIVGTYFKLNKTLANEVDVHFDDEDDLTNYIITHDIKTVIGDQIFRPLIPDHVRLIPLHHTAVSGDDSYD